MAWDTARTKRLLLEAAVEEFAEHGPLGARVDRVASAAKVNKERIYQYFGGKEQLFTAVLESELAKAAEAVPLPATGDGSADAPAPGDLGDFAGRLYDYHSAHPHLLRLLSWEGLRDGRAPVVAETERAAHYADKAARIAALQLDGAVTADFEPGRLFGAAFALATWWLTMPQLARMALSGADGSPEATRDALVRMVRALTEPGTRAR
ncbi:TetR family transcriptional regulator [Streptomyces sp. NPDC088727]|uniref:TetR/AcrR family transcriptional regulator n=1 Tax=Streptomyces sp. NPDC088727 TaxID=3365875 RepID=UPI00380FAD57